MRYIDVPVGKDGALGRVSVLGFGCSALLGRVGRKDSLTALAAALDAGVNFFDTARSYGYGESETLLGEFFHGRRQEVILCTKFGILPGPKGGWKQRVKPLAQAVVRMVPALRSMARRGAAGSSVTGQFAVETLQKSLHTSLRELRTEYVDMLLMHAAPASVLQQDDLLEAMGRLVEQGKVRMAGISGELDTIAATFQARPAVLTTAQFAVNRTTLAATHAMCTPESQQMFLVGNHPFGGPVGVAATMARIAELQQELSLPAELRAKLAGNDSQLMPEVILNVILEGTGISALVPAMMRPSSLRSNVQAVTHCRFTAAELGLLRDELIRRP
jgi:aryl-alcohol dehydrogenase-like predicted oxidoreductase